MAMPLLVGPGLIAYVSLCAREAQEREGGMSLELMVGTADVSLLVPTVLASGRWLQRVLRDIGLNITQRLMGLIDAARG